MTRELCLAQLAAFLDGEGCITILSRKRKTLYGVYHIYQPHVMIANTDKRLIDWLKRNFGGWESKRQPSNPNSRVAYTWYMTNVKGLLRRAYSYLILKREQAQIIIDFPVSKKANGNRTEEDKGRQEQAYLKVRQLNKRGV